MDVGVREGHEFDFQAMFDRIDHPARGRRGGQSGGATKIARQPVALRMGNSASVAMQGKGKQFVAHGEYVAMQFPGGAGYGQATERTAEMVRRDLALGYISPEFAASKYQLSNNEINEVLAKARLGEEF